jgi:hypothetical protein
MVDAIYIGYNTAKFGEDEKQKRNERKERPSFNHILLGAPRM